VTLSEVTERRAEVGAQGPDWLREEAAIRSGREALLTVTRFDDLLLDAVTAIQTMVERGTGWEGAPPEEKGRAVELGRGIAGERRYAKQADDAGLLQRLDALQASATAQLRMLEGRTTPGDEELAARFTDDAKAYATAARPETPA
jgi:hypothetical protein